ncbi:DUF2829 domain-containing protein [Streptomyces tubercidicus]|uniref:DUF2829 domain-containing protein n=1 Tax=Streptomyces tubercidicus TaxID=47759 RepID=UPI0036A3DA19
MDFSEALTALKLGYRAFRQDWKGTAQFVVYQRGYPEGIPINGNTAEATGIPEGTVCRFQPYLMKGTVDGTFIPWSPNQEDTLAEDWLTL